ncbi:MAG TPA: oligopeptide/dipeptide ABC transporter ATP-binding protein, partial [Spirochaetia bacterium]
GMADEVIVMYAGSIVERAGVRSVFKEPRHPYTAGLLESIPSMIEERERLLAIDGVVPSQLDVPPGCAFQPRCAYATARCAAERPTLAPIGEGSGIGEGSDASHLVACWNPLGEWRRAR